MGEKLKPMTVGELKKELENLPDDKKIIIVHEYNGTPAFGILEVWVCEEDMVNPSGDGMEPISVYREDPDWSEDLDNEIVARKGDIFITGIPEDDFTEKF